MDYPDVTVSESAYGRKPSNYNLPVTPVEAVRELGEGPAILLNVLHRWSRNTHQWKGRLTQLEQMTGVSSRTLKRRIASLETQGMIKVDRSLGHWNVYFVLDEAIPRLYQPQAKKDRCSICDSGTQANLSSPPGHSDPTTQANVSRGWGQSGPPSIDSSSRDISEGLPSNPPPTLQSRSSEPSAPLEEKKKPELQGSLDLQGGVVPPAEGLELIKVTPKGKVLWRVPNGQKMYEEEMCERDGCWFEHLPDGRLCAVHDQEDWPRQFEEQKQEKRTRSENRRKVNRMRRCGEPDCDYFEFEGSGYCKVHRSK